MKTVILINGKPRAGKDTAVEMMKDHLTELMVGTEEFSSIDPVKRMLGDWVDLSAKTEADRKLLAVVGDALQDHSQFRTEMCIDRIDEFFSQRRNGVFFLHMREPALIEIVKDNCTVRGIKFVSIYLASIRSEDVTSNAADAGVELGTYDFHMRNDSTLCNLRSAAVQMIDKISLS